MKVVHLAFSPQNEMLFATAGKDHMALCTYDGAKAIKMTKGSSSGNIQSQCSISFSTNPNFKDTCFTGGSDGLIYQWSGNTVA
jgi:WD40 repeat protein